MYIGCITRKKKLFFRKDDFVKEKQIIIQYTVILYNNVYCLYN